ncbi:MAG: hypothetical protein ACR2NM_00290 [Bythopirellula sp.]
MTSVATEQPLSSSPPSTSAPILPESNHRQSVAEFVRWGLAQLDLKLREENGCGRLRLPEADQPHFDGKAELCLPWQPASSNASCEPIDLESRFGRWLLSRLHSLGEAVPIRPFEQPTAVNTIAQELFAAYQVDDGRVHLGGCQLTDYPFLRLSFVATAESQQEVRHVFVAHDGSSVSDQLAQDLGLLDVEPILDLPPRIDQPALRSLVTAGRRVAAQTHAVRDPNATIVDPVATALVWVKHASGTLNFSIGDSTVSLPFSGWAKLLQPQPYTSPRSGASSFHLAATDDGRIDAFDQIATCQHSGQRVLRQDLVTCGVTGKHVLEDFTEACPVSGIPCLTDEFVSCPLCQQRVSKLVVQNNACSACCGMNKIKNDDPRLVWILGEHTGLNRWSNWQLAETKQAYIAQASSWTKRLLVVIDKETLAVHHVASAGKFGSTWTPVAGPARDEILH